MTSLNTFPVPCFLVTPRGFAALALAAGVCASSLAARAGGYASYSDKRVAPDMLIPMVFPVAGECRWSDSFAPNREGGRRTHHGEDLMAAKMTPLVAAFDGTVQLRRAGAPGGHNMLYLRGDNGCTAIYIHINNDTPGTDDGLGSAEYAFAPGLQSGDRVTAGQHIAWVGDSGNAEGGAPHCHFEVWSSEGWVNPAPSLQAAQTAGSLDLTATPAAEPLQVGETRWTGRLRTFHPEWSLAIIDVYASSGHRPNRKPQQVWVRLGKAQITDREGGEVDRGVLSSGMWLTVVGRSGGKGKAGWGRRAVVQSEFSMPSVQIGQAAFGH
jgi:hypothetical protein